MKPNSRQVATQYSRVLAISWLAASLLFATRLCAITWGTADGFDHPNVGAFVVDHPIVGPFPACSGVLIHEQVVLTAGHCIAAMEAALAAGEITLDIVYFTMNPDPFVQPDWRPITSYGKHFINAPSPNQSHDIGAVVLAQPVVGIQPATVAASGFLSSQKQSDLRSAQFVAVGYGASLDFPPPTVDPSEAIRGYSTPRFQSLVGNFAFIQQNGRAGNSGVCYGDSGGALFWIDPATGAETLVAITSGGQNTCISYSYFYRLDTATPQAFIEALISGAP